MIRIEYEISTTSGKSVKFDSGPIQEGCEDTVFFITESVWQMIQDCSKVLEVKDDYEFLHMLGR